MTDASMPTNPSVTLSPQDASVLDRLLEARADAAPAQANWRFSTEPASPPTHDDSYHDQRTQQISQLLDLIGHCPSAEPAQDLVKRTLARVTNDQQRQRFTSQIQSLAGEPRPGFGWSEFMTVAATILIGLSLLWSVLDRSRAEARRLTCKANLAAAGQAFGQYAMDHNNALPRSKTKPGSPWWQIGGGPSADGTVQSNSAHLYILVHDGYLNAQCLSCPDNPHAHVRLDRTLRDWANPAAVSFSYQNQYSPEPIKIDTVPQLALLADRNPLFQINYDQTTNRLIFRVDQVALDSPSRAHGQLSGQNILLADGQVQWSASPRLSNGDNIWVIRGIDQYHGAEVPSDPADSFLVP